MLLARGRYFKWASHDDLYAPTLLQRCVEVLETDPEPVLVHARDAIIDDQGSVVRTLPYPLDTANPRPSARLRSLLYVPGGNDFYGVIRTEVLRRIDLHGSYYNADRTLVAVTCVSRGRSTRCPRSCTSGATTQTAPRGLPVDGPERLSSIPSARTDGATR